MQLSQEELSAVLAGLRLIQSTDTLPLDIADIYYEGGSLAGLTNDEIDDLCERLNVDAPATTEAVPC